MTETLICTDRSWYRHPVTGIYTSTADGRITTHDVGEAIAMGDTSPTTVSLVADYWWMVGQYLQAVDVSGATEDHP